MLRPLGYDRRKVQREADRMTEKAQRASERSRELGQAAKKRSVELGRSTRQSVAQLDVRWAHGPLGHAIREATGRFVLTPLMNLYTRRRVVGRERLKGLKPPIVLVANHASHMDTPAILRALPRRWRRRTVVAAATDYFYRSKVVATLVSVFFNAVPIERGGGGLSPRTTAHIDRHLKRRHNLLLYPEGTRSRQGRVGQLRPGAAVIATKHRASIVPIHVSGTHAAMPPGRRWPKRIRRGLLSRRHEVTITFGTPITPDSDGEIGRAHV